MSWLHPVKPPADGIPINRRCTEGIVEVSGVSVNPYWNNIGTNPAPNSNTVSRIMIPAEPNLPGPRGSQSRYLIRLAAIQIEPRKNAIIHGLRQYLDIGLDVNVGEGQTYPLFQPILSPYWSFSDANVSFHLTVLRGAPTSVASPGRTSPFIMPAGWSQILDSSATGIMAQNAVPGVGHVNLFVGDSPGDPVGDLGCFNDIRFPHLSSAQGSMAWMIEGPCLIGFYASVLQTVPPGTQPPSPLVVRPVLPAPDDISSLGIEERFLQSYPGARYYSVAGSMLIEEVPSK